MSDTYAKGWAVIDDRGLNVKTVSPTKRAAIVNWLTLTTLPIREDHTDEEIEYLFERYGTGPGRATVQRVKIQTV